MKAVGITCGIGSMLVGARDAGFKVIGNVEWREYYRRKDDQGRNTFLENFEDSTLHESLEQMTEAEFEKFSNADLALGHPECGGFSQLSGANKNRLERLRDPADIPLFTRIVSQLKPRFFVMDDLPKSFIAYPMEKYAEQLPNYDLFPEWVSNWGYGNVQKGRKRMFMIGALKSERWTFRPGEQVHSKTVRDVLEDLPEPRKGSNVPNQDPHDNNLDCFRALNLGTYRKKSTWGEVQEYFRNKRGGHTLDYVRIDGSVVKRIGFLKGHWDGPSHVLTGGNAILHALRCEPYTLRERARIQGFPDDFVFYGTAMNEDGEWNHDLNQHMIRQTGKAMPVQFCRYASEQVAAHIQGRSFATTGARVIPPNEHVDAAKQWYCQNVGYAAQEAACGACWMAKGCAIRTDKYGYTPLSPARPQRPAAAVKVDLKDDSPVAKSKKIAPLVTTELRAPAPIKMTTFGDPQ